MLQICLFILQLFWGFNLVSAFDITKPPFDDLKLSGNVLGLHTLASEHNTPPSKIQSNWHFLMKNGDSDAAKIGKGCPDDSTLCGIFTGMDTSKPIQLFSVSDKDAQFTFDNSSSSYFADWNGVTYGDYTIDVRLQFQCSDSEDNELEWTNESLLIENNLNFIWKNKQFCYKNKNNDNSKNPNNNDSSSSSSGLGFFGTIVLIMAVAFAGYLVAQAWFNTSTMGSSGDFFNELVDTVVESVSSIPRLLIEIINKITGSSNTSRGGYSAV
jgi:hypothetical protein